MGVESDCIVLIPGIFGFGTFGGPVGPRIDYFAQVKRVLSERTGIPVARIRSAQPPPTGTIAHRVAELVQEIEAALADPATQPRARIHLIGHSTGGVDARLLANAGYSAFAADGAVTEERRARVVARLGRIVTIAAPFHGTPCAVKLEREFLGLVAGLSAWNALDHGGALTRALGPFLATALATLEAVARDPHANEAVVALFERLGLDAPTVEQLVRFRRKICSDRGLIFDLAPRSMAATNAGLKRDHPGIASYVTVAPKPALGDLSGLERRAIYLLLYSATSQSTFSPVTFPEGRWLVGAPDAKVLGEAPEACDGVVPSSSQTIDGSAAGIVVADHEDVIGHFDGEKNTTLFKSGAGFTYSRFVTLWSDVAARLGGG